MLSKKITFISAAAILVEQCEATKLHNKNQFFDFPHFGSFMNMGHDSFFDSGFGGFGGFNNVEKDMERMEESMSKPMIGGNTQSQSFSKSSSSEMGQDGQMHTKQQQSGQKTECLDGHCKVVDCADGKCEEKEEEVSPQAMKEQSNQLAHGSPFASNFGSGFGNIDNSIEDSMHQMHANMANAEHQMEDAFSHVGEMPKLDGNGEMQEQSFQSSSSSAMGEDGQMHSKEIKSGDKVECHNGHCKQIKCENGKCQERDIDSQHQQDPESKEMSRSGFQNQPKKQPKANMAKQKQQQAPKGDDGEDLVPMSEGPRKNSNPGDHRDAFKKMMKDMANPNKQGGGNPMQSGGNPMQGGGNPMQSGGNPMQSGGNPMQSGGNPMQGGGKPMQGGGNPMQGGGNPMQGGGNQQGEPKVIEIDPSTPEGAEQLKEIMKMMKDPRHQIKQMGGGEQQQMNKNGGETAKNGLKSGVKMVGSDSQSEGVAKGSGRNFNPNAHPSEEQRNPSEQQSESHPSAEWAPKGKLLFQMRPFF